MPDNTMRKTAQPVTFIASFSVISMRVHLPVTVSSETAFAKYDHMHNIKARCTNINVRDMRFLPYYFGSPKNPTKTNPPFMCAHNLRW